ncbi:MAG TPA: hemerythrin domain-containing protein [Acidobacteriaceae bacterium]|jgi:hemerythrin-like domain-containing protein|nr:hemerythrin domain-containing protein [Acidobacteriaceae bacterium]
MPVQIGAKLDSGFDDPLGMLHDCHRRIERFLVILCDVPERARSRSLTSEEAAAVRTALHYFREGGRRHTTDEEESLFPRMRDKMRDSSSSAALVPLNHLEDDHRQAGQLHDEVDRLYSAWLSSGALTPDQEQALLEKTRRLRGLYAEHIQAEETAIFPQAARLLDRDTIAAIGAEFKARRLAKG